MELTQKDVTTVLTYNEKTGIFTRKVRTSNSMKIGDIAGTTNKKLGYVAIGIYGIQYYAHRLAWLYKKGEWPKHQIDHINGQRNDNTWSNLRSVTLNENRKNHRVRKNCTTLIQGVKWMKSKNKWRARIGPVHLCVTTDFFEACCKRKSAELRLGYHPNHGH